MSKARGAITAAVWWRLIKKALLWLIPALLALPIYLILLAISVLASEGSLLEITDGVRGGINAAIGPLLVLCGVAAGVATALLGTDANEYINGGFFALITVGLGAVIIGRELRVHAAAS